MLKDHLEVQKIIQKHIDNAVSKTINIPKNYSVESLDELWLEYLPYLKGTTFYREGSRGYVNKETGEIEEPPLTPLSLEEAIKRFKKIEDKKEVIEGTPEQECTSGMCSL